MTPRLRKARRPPIRYRTAGPGAPPDRPADRRSFCDRFDRVVNFPPKESKCASSSCPPPWFCLLASTSASAAPCFGASPFTDVAAGETYCTSTEWLKNRNITLGCTATTYCPNDYVTRAQMALFMNRLG